MSIVLSVSVKRQMNREYKQKQAFKWSNGKWIQTHNRLLYTPKPDAHVSTRVDLPAAGPLDRRELCATGLHLAKPYICTIFALVKILFNCKYSWYNLTGKFENSSYKSSPLHALRAVYLTHATALSGSHFKHAMQKLENSNMPYCKTS